MITHFNPCVFRFYYREQLPHIIKIAGFKIIYSQMGKHPIFGMFIETFRSLLANYSIRFAHFNFLYASFATGYPACGTYTDIPLNARIGVKVLGFPAE